MPTLHGLTPAQLRRCCDPELFAFKTTAELEDLRQPLGQPRAVDALELGISMDSDGYNIFAFGPRATGKHHLIHQALASAASGGPKPWDLCYVNNFARPHQPAVLRLPAGEGAKVQEDMRQLVDELRTALSSAFESEEYQARRQMLEEELKEVPHKAFEELDERARKEGLTLLRTPVGVVLAPLKDGEVIPPAEFQQLPEKERSRLEEATQSLQREVQKVLRQVPGWERHGRERLRELHREITRVAVKPLIDDLRQRQAELPDLLEHLDAVETDVLDHAREILSDGGDGGAQPAPWLAGDPWVRRYQVNVLVDHGESTGAPVVYEDNPTYANLLGRVEHVAHMGALLTDFNLIKAGALHRANDGYLVLEARRVLSEPFAWEALKRALRSKQIKVESLGQSLGLVSTVSLEPEPVPLHVKVVLIGEPWIYYLLSALDPEMPGLFKVAADFDDRMPRESGNEAQLARLVATLSRKEKLRALDRGAVARVIEEQARSAGDGKKLSTEVGKLQDLLREADHWASVEGREVIGVPDVERALGDREHRVDRLRERLSEAVLRGQILVDTAGEKVGQVNGLSVISLGDFAFGQPHRITARARLGKGEVVDIEREVELGGPLHSKGVLILSSFLSSRYAPGLPLSLSASLVFEQSYGDVEGDSASSAELYALLSAISEVPLKQSLAVTGSVNQHGEIQAIGGVNEKIEGFFDLCKARGLSGEQGVLIPASNVVHLMLRPEVVEAVAAGRFHVYPVTTVDEGLELLSGQSAGERDSEGLFPEDSMNGKVEARLVALAAIAADFSRGAAGVEVLEEVPS